MALPAPPQQQLALLAAPLRRLRQRWGPRPTLPAPAPELGEQLSLPLGLPGGGAGPAPGRGGPGEVEPDPDEVERLAHAQAEALGQLSIPEPRFRGKVPSRYALIERWGWAALEVWCIRTGFDAKHRRLFREQWVKLKLAEAWAERRFDALFEQVEERVLALLRPAIEAPPPSPEE